MTETTRTIVTRIQNKYDHAADWIENNPVLLTGEIGYESDTGKFKIGDGDTHWNELDYATTLPTEVEEYIKYSNNNPTTISVGGIKQGTTFSNKSIISIIEDLLYPYVAPIFSSISTVERSGTFEYGTTKEITKVTPNFTNGSKNINSIKIGTTDGGDDLYSGTSAVSGNQITLTEPKSYDGEAGGTIYCTLSDGTTTLKQKTTINYAYYTYWAVTDSDSIPTGWIAANSTSVSDLSIAANTGQYIWIACSNSNYDGICELNELSGKYNAAAPTIKFTKQTLKNSQNYDCIEKYTFYRLEAARAASGTSMFKLK